MLLNTEMKVSMANKNVAASLQNYGLKAAYPVQTGEESSNHLQSSSGAVYVRAYDNQDGNQAPYKVQQQGEDNYQAEDTHQKETYSPYVSPKDSGSDSQKETSDKLSLAATGRSSDTLVGSPTVTVHLKVVKRKEALGEEFSKRLLTYISIYVYKNLVRYTCIKLIYLFRPCFPQNSLLKLPSF
ncbi:uncharacterized protein CEXT_60771 [Caerostris extrusa]|uniref:Uncharacterized protein n=1 Tax=Caerostris extrusa TaxID=172846 RepID=A0AAV4XCB7_CAEEX|nr:uncharacterized protein CEXT_60771 [Caerostris extrusa]